MESSRERDLMAELRMRQRMLQLSAYDCEIDYKKKNQFEQADALSRLVAKEKSPDTKENSMILKIDEEVEAAILGTVEQLLVTKEEQRRETHKDKELNGVITSVLSGGQKDKRGLWKLCFRVARQI